MPAPSQDPTPHDRLLVMQQAFHKALSAFQGCVQGAKRDGRNTHLRSTYATLSSVIEALKPAAEYGLSYTQTTEREGDEIVLVTTMRHVDGFEVRSELPLPRNPDWQKFGSALSYARRYSLMAIFGLGSSDEDDDGATASAMPSAAKASGRAKPAPVTADPLDARRKVIAQTLAKLNNTKQGEAQIKALVAEFQAAFGLPSTALLGQSMTDADRLSWLEQRLSLPPSPASNDDPSAS